jgi:hypothetical protein
MTTGSDEKRAFFVPVALSDIEAVAVKSACAVVVTSAPGPLPPSHPLFTGMLKIESAYREAKASEADR